MVLGWVVGGDNGGQRIGNGEGIYLGFGYGYDGTGNFPGNRDFPDLRVPGKIPPGTRVFLS